MCHKVGVDIAFDELETTEERAATLRADGVIITADAKRLGAKIMKAIAAIGANDGCKNNRDFRMEVETALKESGVSSFDFGPLV